MSNVESTNATVKEIFINASAERVFEAIVDPSQRVKWWGVKGRHRKIRRDCRTACSRRWSMRRSGLSSCGCRRRLQWQNCRTTWCPHLASTYR
jgi:uncharacterized protein YndB with AHSA1/START domain